MILYSNTKNYKCSSVGVLYDDNAFIIPDNLEGLPKDARQEKIKADWSQRSASIDKIAKWANNLEADLILIDIESWGVPPWLRIEQVGPWIYEVINILHIIRPDLDIGWFGGYPLRRETYGLQNPLALNEHPGRITKWREDNEKILYWLNGSDYLAPCCYTYDYSGPTWKSFLESVRHLVSTAKRDSDLPIYPVLWNCYYRGPWGSLGQPMQTDHWVSILETVIPFADNIILWSDPKHPIFNKYIDLAIEACSKF